MGSTESMGLVAAGALAKGISKIIAGGVIAALSTGAGFSTCEGSGTVFPSSWSAAVFLALVSGGVALLQAYSANKLEKQINSQTNDRTKDMGSTHCITNIRKSWKLHYM